MKTALLLIDIQKDYFPGGKMALHEPERAAANAKAALVDFRRESMPVVHVQHVNIKQGASFFLEGTEGVRFYEEVLPLEGEYVVKKHTPNGFYQTDLQNILEKEGVGALVVCGMMSHMCIDTTVRSAKDNGYEITLLADACTTTDLIFQGKIIPALMVHQTFMAALDGYFTNVCSTAAFLDKHKEKLQAFCVGIGAVTKRTANRKS